MKVHLRRTIPVHGVVTAYCGKVVTEDKCLVDDRHANLCSNCLWAYRRAKSAEKRELREAVGG